MDCLCGYYPHAKLQFPFGFTITVCHSYICNRRYRSGILPTKEKNMKILNLLARSTTGACEKNRIILNFQFRTSFFVSAVFHITKYRIIESFEVEGTLKGYLVQFLCNEQGHLQLDPFAQNLVQPDLKCLQGWDIHHLSGQPLSVPHHPDCKKT